MADSKKDAVPLDAREQEGRLLRGLVEACPLSQADLAAASGIGNKAYLTQLMSGARPLNLKAACQLATTLKVTIDDFSPRLAESVRRAIPLIRQDAVNTAAKSDFSKTPPHWPLGDVDPGDFDNISEQGKREIIAFARGMARENSNARETAVKAKRA